MQPNKKDAVKSVCMREIEDNNWGELVVYTPPESSPNKTHLNICLFCAYSFGYLALKQIISDIYNKNSYHISLVATDDPTSKFSKISKNKRHWQYYKEQEKELIFSDIKNTLNSNSINFYTGSVKSDYFLEFFNQLDIDLILIAGFGQILPQIITKQATYGCFNFHPGLELETERYRGPDPFKYMLKNSDPFTFMNLHYVTDVVDGGELAAKSIPINISLQDPTIDEFTKRMLIYEKATSATAYMVKNLLREVWARHSSKNTQNIEFSSINSKIKEEIETFLNEPIVENSYTFTRPSESPLLNFIISK